MTAYGAPTATLTRSALLRAWRRRFGADDFHSHVRWWAVRKLLDVHAQRTLEIGAGRGLMSLQTAWHAHAIDATTPRSYDLFDTDDAALGVIERLAPAWPPAATAKFWHGDADRGLSDLPSGHYDQVLLVDVLEHVSAPDALLAEIARVLRPGGHLVLSVPSPRYPTYFTRAFADEIGHLVDGFTEPDLRARVAHAGLRVDVCFAYTSPVAGAVARVFYDARVRRGPRALRLLRTAITPTALALSAPFEELLPATGCGSWALRATRPS